MGGGLGYRGLKRKRKGLASKPLPNRNNEGISGMGGGAGREGPVDSPSALPPLSKPLVLKLSEPAPIASPEVG